MIKLTQKIIDDLFDIYKGEFGPVISITPKIDSVESFLKTFGCFEYRAGSKWTGHSKFIITHSRVSFYINADTGTYNEEEVKKAEESFNNRVKQYLESIV